MACFWHCMFLFIMKESRRWLPIWQKGKGFKAEETKEEQGTGRIPREKRYGIESFYFREASETFN